MGQEVMGPYEMSANGTIGRDDYAAWSLCVGKDRLKRASAFKPDLARLSVRMLKRDLSKWGARVFGDRGELALGRILPT